MERSHDGADSSSGGSYLAWLNDPELQRARLKAQVDIIVSSLEDAAAYSAPDGALEYMYRKARILVRDGDLPRVQAEVPGTVTHSLINGVSAFEPADGDTQNALRYIDRTLGVGVATP